MGIFTCHLQTLMGVINENVCYLHVSVGSCYLGKIILSKKAKGLILLYRISE